MQSIKSAWSGEEKLWKVFWLYNFILGSALLYALDYAASLGTAFEVVTALVVLIWLIWVVVALWRCAFNARWKGWGYISRGVVIFSVAMFAIAAIGPFIGIDPDSL